MSCEQIADWAFKRFQSLNLGLGGFMSVIPQPHACDRGLQWEHIMVLIDCNVTAKTQIILMHT